MVTFKSPSPLQPVGFGAPDLNYAVTPQLAQQLQPVQAPDTTGLQILSKAGDSLQQTLQAQAQSNKVEEQASIQLSRQQAESQSAITQTTLASLQSSAQSAAQSASSWSRLGDNVLKFVGDIAEKEEQERKLNAKQREAEAEARRKQAAIDLKTELDNNQVKATTELENLQIQWIGDGLIDQQGPLAYRKAVGDILAKYRMEPDTISALTVRYYSPALEHAKRVNTNQIKVSEEVIVKEREKLFQSARFELSTSFAGMKSADVGVNSASFDRFDGVIKKIEADPKLTKLDRLTVVGNLLTIAVDSSAQGTEVRAKIDGYLKYNREASAFYNENASRVNSGEITDDMFQDGWNLVRAQNGLPPEDSPSTTRNAKAQADRDKLKLEILKTNDDTTRRAIDALPANSAVTNGLAAQMYLDPTVRDLVREEIKSNRADKNARAAYEFSGEAIKFRDIEQIEHLRKLGQLNKDITSLSSAGTVELLRMGTSTKGGDSGGPNIENLRNALAGLGVGAGVGSTPERPVYSQEQLEVVRKARQEDINALGRNVALEKQIWAKRQSDMARRGIFIDPVKTRDYLKQLQSTINGYNESVKNINNQPRTTPQGGGQVGNFNSGVSRKPAVAPLMKRSYGGRMITMPFDMNVGDVSQGQRFGADRDDGARKHAGLDFATPVGTPIKSLVSGTVVGNAEMQGYGKTVQVRGDDGFTYFYAHMDKNLLANGTKVGAGQTVGLSGKTGAGTGPHLHMEVWVNKPGDAFRNRDDVINPLTHLATRQFGDKAPMVRTASGRPSAQELPPGAYPLGGGAYLLDGRVVAAGRAPQAQQPSSGGGGVDVYKLPAYNPDPTKLIPNKAGMDIVGFVNTATSNKDKVLGVASYRNKAGGILTLTIPYPKRKMANVPQTFGFDGRGFKAEQATSPTLPAGPSTSMTGKGTDLVPGVAMPKRGKNTPSGLGPRQPKGVPAKMEFNSLQMQPQTFSGDQYTALVMSIFEAPTAQGRLDAIAVMVNRAGGNHHGKGTSLRSQVFASGQFEPVTRYGLGTNDIQDRASALKALTKTMSPAQAEAALSSVERDILNPNMQRESESKIRGKRFFKGVSMYGDMRPGHFLRQRGENFYHDEPGESYKTGTPMSRFFKQRGSSDPRPNTPIKSLPPGAIRVGPNRYLDPDTKAIKVGSAYHDSSPFQPSYAPMSAVAYAPTTPDDNFGYEQLETDKTLLSGVHTLAAKHNVPPQWVADAAMMKGTSGIQDDTLDQIDTLLESKKPGSFKTTTKFIAATLPEMEQKEANLNFGIHGGRRYDSVFSQVERAKAPTHTALAKNCSLCVQISAQAVFTPHKAESFA